MRKPEARSRSAGTTVASFGAGIEVPVAAGTNLGALKSPGDLWSPGLLAVLAVGVVRDLASDTSTTHTGKQLGEGIPVTLDPATEKHLVIR